MMIQRRRGYSDKRRVEMIETRRMSMKRRE